MIASARRTVGASRDRLAALAGLRWLRIGRFDIAVPVVAGLIGAAFLWQLGEVYGMQVAVPFALAWVVLTASGVALLALARRFAPASVLLDRAGFPRSWPLTVLIVWAVCGWLLYDGSIWAGTNHLYDFNVYLGSAGRWLDGGQPYMTAPESSWPTSPAADFFLYPPPLLPFFGLLSRLPFQPVAAAWVAFLTGCAYASFRAFGLRRLWSLVLLAFPPVMLGLESGNVAAVILLLFALGYRSGGCLVVDGLFKVQAGIPALWLLRTRRWRPLVAGLAAAAAIALATLPLTGLAAWGDWLAGLAHRSESQAAVRELYGFSVAQHVPDVAFAGLACLAVALALAFRGRRGLAALGLASIVASPALWPHGFAVALPAVLMLESGAAVWLALGAGAIEANMWLLFYLGWVAVLAAPRLPDALHPLSGAAGPWRSDAPTASRRATTPGGARTGRSGPRMRDNRGTAEPT